MLKSVIFSIYNSVVASLIWIISNGTWNDTYYWVDRATWSDVLSVLYNSIWNDVYFWNDESVWED